MGSGISSCDGRARSPIATLITFLLLGSSWTGNASTQERGGPHQAITQILERGDTGSVLILIPCAGCGAASWNRFMDANETRFRMIAVTLPGYAGSPQPDLPTWTDQTAFQDNAVDQISHLIRDRGLSDVTIVGQSFGSTIGLLVAQANPTTVTALVNVDGYPWSPPGMSDQSPTERFANAQATVDEDWALRLQDPEAFRQFNAARNLPTDDERLSHHGMFMASDRISMLHYWRENLLRDINPAFLGLSIPFLNVKAVSPRIPDADSLLDTYHATLDSIGRPLGFHEMVFHQSSHWIHVEHPRLLGTAMAMFLNGQHPPDVGPFRMGHVEQMGSGNRDLILMPCLGCDWTSWDEFMTRNRDRYRMHAVTWPGLGDTPLPSVLPDTKGTPYFDYLMLTLKHLIERQELERPIIVGHSATAVLAVRFAAEYPELVGGVVNVDAIVANLGTYGYSVEQRLAWADSEMADVLRRYDSDTAWTALNSPPNLPDSARARFYSSMWLTPPRHHVLAYWRDWLRTDAGSSYAKLQVPFLAIHALSEDSSRARSKRQDLERRYALAPSPPGARVEYVVGAGHTIWEWTPNMFDEVLAEFVLGSGRHVRVRPES